MTARITSPQWKRCESGPCRRPPSPGRSRTPRSARSHVVVQGGRRGSNWPSRVDDRRHRLPRRCLVATGTGQFLRGIRSGPPPLHGAALATHRSGMKMAWSSRCPNDGRRPRRRQRCWPGVGVSTTSLWIIEDQSWRSSSNGADWAPLATEDHRPAIRGVVRGPAPMPSCRVHPCGRMRSTRPSSARRDGPPRDRCRSCGRCRSSRRCRTRRESRSHGKRRARRAERATPSRPGRG